MGAPLESPPGADANRFRELQSELEETARWMREAAGLTRSPLHAADAELREACGKIADALVAGRPPLDDALEHILEARRHAISAMVRRIVKNAYDLRNDVGRGFLQERFPQGQYGDFFRLTERATELVRAAESRADARAELFAWARETLPVLRDMFGQLRASEAAIIDAKAERDWEQKRDKFRFRLAAILAAVLAAIGWLVAAILALL